MSNKKDKMPTKMMSMSLVPSFIQSSIDLSQKDKSSKKSARQEGSKSKEKPTNGKLEVKADPAHRMVSSVNDLSSIGQSNPYVLHTYTTLARSKSSKQADTSAEVSGVAEPIMDSNMRHRNASHYGQAHISSNPRAYISSQKCLVTSREAINGDTDTWAWGARTLAKPKEHSLAQHKKLHQQQHTLQRQQQQQLQQQQMQQQQRAAMAKAPPGMFTQIAKITDSLGLCAAAAVTPDRVKWEGWTTIVNATMEVPSLRMDSVECIKIQIEDAPHSKLIVYFDRCADKINETSKKGGKTLVHCVAGVSRSASLCIAYLMKYHRMSLLQAYRHVKSRRTVIRPNVGFFKQLIEYEKKLFGRTTVKFVDSPIGPVPDVYQPETKNMVWLTTYNSSFGKG